MTEHIASRRVESRKARLIKALEDLITLRLCGPSDDPDEQTGVIESYKYLLIQIKTLAKGLVSEDLSKQLEGFSTKIESVYEVYG